MCIHYELLQSITPSTVWGRSATKAELLTTRTTYSRRDFLPRSTSHVSHREMVLKDCVVAATFRVHDIPSRVSITVAAANGPLQIGDP